MEQLALVHGSHGEVDSAQDEGVGEGVDDKEVRVLNQQYGDCGKGGRQQAHSPAVKSGANEVDQEDRGGVEHGRCRAPYDVNLVVPDLTNCFSPDLLNGLSHDAHQEDRERAVDKEGVADVIGIEG